MERGSMNRLQLVDIFLQGKRPHGIPADIWYIIFQISGLCSYGKHISSFQIYFRPSNKWQNIKRLVARRRSNQNGSSM